MITLNVQKPKRFNIEPVSRFNPYITTDKQRRIRLSADLAEMQGWREGVRLVLGYDATTGAIALAQPNKVGMAPETANKFDARLYTSARKFYEKTKIVRKARKYHFETEEDGWLIFLPEK
ncbi:hypothetical protein BN871_AT_00590 [Paenibacillus sp. P22]|nr:hypothetical protein BN871_AT_00590 [Paenibacillus sp. P22]